MWMFIQKKFVPFLIGICALGAFGILFSRLYTIRYAYAKGDGQLIYDALNVPIRPVAIVFGAGLRWDGTPTAILRDRIVSAVALYKMGKVSKLLMSGDNRTTSYNEPEAMRQYALELGVPDTDIILDYAGLRTYDTCYRARHIFGIDKATLVTQDFHMPRSLYTCNALGIDAIGVAANNQRYRRSSLVFWDLREAFASLVALWEVNVFPPTPILGRPEPIFTKFDQTETL